MARRDRESVYDSDTHDLLFGGEADGADGADGAPRGVQRGDHLGGHHNGRPADRARPGSRPATRVEARQAGKAQRRRRVFALSATIVVLILGAAIYFIGLPVYRYLSPDDYDGAGTGSVVVTVHANDGASDIGQILVKADVVASVRAFTDAADNNDGAQNIQPGSYKLNREMSAERALSLLLDPASRIDSDTVVPEGANVFSVEQRLTAPRCGTATSTASTRGCGLGVAQAAVVKAITDVKSLGIPTDYLPGGKDPTTIEGFLYPATYSFDDETTLTEALQQMVGKFTDVARSNRFSTAAKALAISPYQALTIASMVQAEAKFSTDMPKVTRVILNRLKAKLPLKIDATSVYAAELAGLDPKKINFPTVDSPYNTYRNSGLPPSPISNPGSDALKAAVTPSAGNWTFYVNGDAKGHLFFTNSEAAFIKAQKRCADKGWGCAQP